MRAVLAVLIALPVAACGRLGFDATGGTGGDAQGAGDAEPDAGPGVVTVVLRAAAGAQDEGQLVEGADVYFVDADGNLAAERTDVDGVATHDVAGATTVHVVRTLPVSGGRLMYTIVGVGGGARLELGQPSGPDQNQVAWTLQVQPATGATTYRVAGAVDCIVEGESATPSIAVASACEGQEIPIYASAEGAGTALPGWLFAGTPTITAGSTLIPGGGWTQKPSHTAHFRTMPADLKVGFQARHFEGAHLVALSPGTTFGTAGDSDSTVETLGLSIDNLLVAYVSATNDPGVTLISEPPPTETASGFTVDGSRLISRIVDGTATPAGVGWSFVPLARAPTLVLVGAELVLPGGGTLAWQVYARPGAATVAYPTLPAPYDAAPMSVGATTYVGLLVPALDFADSVTRVESESFDFLVNHLAAGWGVTLWQPSTERRAPPATVSDAVRRLRARARRPAR